MKKTRTQKGGTNNEILKRAQKPELSGQSRKI